MPEDDFPAPKGGICFLFPGGYAEKFWLTYHFHFFRLRVGPIQFSTCPGANFQVLDTANLKNSWAPQQKIRSKHVPGQIHMRPGSSRTTHPKWWWWFSKGSVPQNALKTFRFRNYSKLPRCTANRCFFYSKSSKM